MDDELLAFLSPNETAAQLLARTAFEPLRSGIPFLDSHTVLRPGQVVELVGTSGTAKTQVLTLLAAHALLQGGGVVVLDLDGKFDILRLCRALETRLESGPGGQLESEQLKTACLQQVHLIQNCHSSRQLLAALKALPLLLSSLQGLEQGRIRWLLIDNIAAYYWVDRACKWPGQTNNIAGPSDPASRSGYPLTLQRVYLALAQELKKLQQQFGLVVIATKQAVFGGGDGGDGWDVREFLPRAWHDLVTHRVSLHALHALPGQVSGFGHQRYAAKWQLPSLPSLEQFAVNDGWVVRA